MTFFFLILFDLVCQMCISKYVKCNIDNKSQFKIEKKQKLTIN